MPFRLSSSHVVTLLRITGLAAAYFAIGKLGLTFAFLGDNVSLIWLPAGLAVAALVLWGLRLWPGVWLGAFAVPLTTQISVTTSFAIATGNTIAAFIAAALLVRGGFNPAFLQPRDLLRFSLYGVVVGPVFAATTGTLSLISSASVPWSNFMMVWLQWTLGDGVGVLVMAPALLSWVQPPAKWVRQPWKSPQGREAALLAASLLVICILLWGPIGTSSHLTPLAFLTFPLLMWAGLSFGVRGSSSATVLLAFAAIGGTAAGFGPFVRDSVYESAVLLWTFLGVTAVTSLITAILFERHRVTATLHESEERLKLALEGSEDGIWDWDLVTHQMTFNSRWTAMLGYDDGDLEPTWEGWIQLIHPKDAAGVKKAIEAHLAGKIPAYQTEHRMRDREGQWRWVLARGKVVLRDELGAALRMTGTHKDITDRKLAREAQIRSEALVRAILETAPDGVITISRHGAIESFNAAAERIFGYSTSEVLGQDIRLLMPEESAEVGAVDALSEFLRGDKPRTQGRTREMTGRRRDGIAFPIELSLGEVQLREDQRLLTGIVRDVTVRKEAEENLKLFRAMVENTSEGVQLTRIRDEVIVYANPALERMFGYKPGELMGESVSCIYTSEEQSTEEFVLRMNRQMEEEGIWRGEVRSRRKNGSFFWCAIRISTFDHPRYGGVWVSVHEDITEKTRVDEERRWLEDQLRQAHRLESIGQLAGGVAHEFNNLLVVIGGHLGFALDQVPDGAPVREDLDQARAAAERAATLTHKLLAFSRRQVLEPANVDLNNIVRELMTMMRTAVTEHIVLEFQPGDSLGTVHVDVHQIEQVLLNLCVNARDAMPAGGTIEIRTSNVELDEAYARRHPWARPGSYVLLAVQDTGQGMDLATLERIFEPFFTTKEEGAGTGLGLSMVHGVVQQHQALLNVESNPGQGSTFFTYWPRVESEAERRPEKAAEPDATRSSGVLILAEDDETVRNVARRILEAGGYTVLTAENGEEALRIFEGRFFGDKNSEDSLSENQSAAVDLVILDLIMPVMGGLAAREAMLKIDPKARILLASGYSAGPMHQGPGGVEIPLVVKPFDRRSLLSRVREVLGGSITP